MQYPGQTETEPFARVHVLARRHRRGARLPAPARHSERRGAHRDAGGGGLGVATPSCEDLAVERRGPPPRLDAHRRARRRRPRPREQDPLMPRRSDDIAIIGWRISPMVRSTDKTETQMLLEVITGAVEHAGITRAEVDFTCAGSCDYVAGQAFSFVQNIDAIGAVAAEARLARRDGRRLGAVRGLAPAAARRHRRRGGHGLRPLVDRRPGAHLPDGDGPVLPGPARRRPARLRRAAGPGAHRRGHGRPSGRWPRSRPGPDATRRATRTRRCSGDFDVDALLAEDYVAAPLRPPRPPADHRRRVPRS